MTSPSHVWAAYVRHLRTALGESQVQFAKRAFGKAGSQGKISRWEDGLNPPNRAADVADFARALGRNPLEAFVAAGMLDAGEAGRGLDDDERRIVASAASAQAGATEPLLLRALEGWAAHLSDPSANLGAVAKKGRIEGAGENSI